MRCAGGNPNDKKASNAFGWQLVEMQVLSLSLQENGSGKAASVAWGFILPQCRLGIPEAPTQAFAAL